MTIAFPMSLTKYRAPWPSGEVKHQASYSRSQLVIPGHSVESLKNIKIKKNKIKRIKKEVCARFFSARERCARRNDTTDRHGLRQSNKLESARSA